MTALCSNKESGEDSIAEDRGGDETAFLLKSYDYVLPPDLIAQKPLDQRDESRLMVVSREDGLVTHTRFYNIIEYLRPDDLVVINNTKVFPARVIGRKPSGGSLEILLLQPAVLV